MAKLVKLRVEVIETDEDGKEISALCSHEESYSASFFAHSENRDELIQCAYEGFLLARNEFTERAR